MTTRLHLIPTAPGMGRSLVAHDERSKNFRAIPRGSSLSLRDRTWRRGGPYDQGQTSTCVAQTGKGLLNTLPKSHDVPYRVRSKYSTLDFYEGAQENDEWAGEDYDGTSGLGLCKYFLAKGLISEYNWCFGLQDVLLTLGNIGPVGIGIWWYSGMFDPNSEGIVEPTGYREGGHEVELLGVDLKNRFVEGINSWGADWGNKGRFRLSWDNLDRLLNEEGDAFTIVR